MITMTAPSRRPDPLRDSRFGWLVLDAWVVRTGMDPNDDLPCVLLTPTGHPGDPAEQAMPVLAETVGLNPQPGTDTPWPNTVHVTVAEPGWITLHLGGDVALRRSVHPQWQQAARARGWVKLVISYRVMPPDAHAASFVGEALRGAGVTATVLVGPLPSGHPDVTR